jgi:hypothetical protein
LLHLYYIVRYSYCLSYVGIWINLKERSGSGLPYISFRILNAPREVRQRQKEKKARGSKHEAAQIERQVKQQMEGQDPALVRQVERQLVKHPSAFWCFYG